MTAKFWNPQKGSGSSKGSGTMARKKSGFFGRFGNFKVRLSPKQKKIAAAAAGLFVLLFVSAYIFLISPALALMTEFYNLRGDVSLIRSGFSNRDLIQMRSGFDAAESRIASIRDVRDSRFGWVAGFGPLKDYYADSEAGLTTGEHLIAAGREMATLSEPFADAIGLRVSEAQEPSELSLIDAFASWVSIMPEIAEDIDAVIAELTLAGESLENIDASRYPERLAPFPAKLANIEARANLVRAQAMLTSLNDAAPDIKKALTVIPTLLGADGRDLRYMVIMQNDKELRPTGGFWTNYATFRVANAMLNSDFSSHDMYSIDETLLAIDSWYDFPDAPPAYATYLKVNHLYARDANYSPDYPTSVENFKYFYNLAMPLNASVIKPVDGIFAIDTVVLEELMEVTGPVTVRGFTYTSENVVLELEKLASLTLAEQAGRKDILGDLMQAMLINVFESDGFLWPSLIETGVDLAVRKHILVYVNDEEAQALIEEYGLAGHVISVEEGEDYAYLVSTNLGGDKTNWFVEKEVTHGLEEVDGRLVRTVKATFNYEQPEPQYGAFVKRYQDWLRLYVPEGSELIESTGFANGFGGGDELGKTYFDGFFALGPGETKEVSFKYYLPDNFVNPEGKYVLYVQKQPGIESEIHRVELNGTVEELELIKDHVFEVSF